MMIKKHKVLTVKFRGIAVGTLAFSPDNKTCVFEYDREWLVKGFSISPLEIPLRPGVFVAKPMPFNGGFGIFEDSLPDGYGRYLLHKALQKEGIDDAELTVLDRLSLVGSGGMGALTYHPETSFDNTVEVYDFDILQAKALEVLRERQNDDAELLLFKSGNSGGARPKSIFADVDGHWLVKFRHTYDSVEIGRIEYLYNSIARKCGIDVPEFKLINDKYFACRRFDIDSNNLRLHTATAGGLLGISLGAPILDYNNLLALTGYLTQNPAAVEEMFRRMVFNYLTDNKDDHCKNFSYLVTEDEEKQWKWQLAPAYDLTLSKEGYNGEHATSVNGTGRPKLADFIKAGTSIKMNEQRCRKIFEQVYENCRDILHYKL